MHPAYSVILFTTASGAGYGLLALLGLTAASHGKASSPGFALTAMFVALAFITVGLLSSTAHLGRPERAWRALSQWRSSWLSREGVAAVLTYPVALAFGVCWAGLADAPALIVPLGLLTALMCGVTVYCTGMIYAQLKTIPAWYNRFTVPGYFVLGLATGAALLTAVSVVFGQGAGGLQTTAVLLFICAAIVLKWFYWRWLDSRKRSFTMADATGLGAGVRQWEVPHTARNFIMKEMGFRVAQRHSVRLQRITLILLGVALVLAVFSLAQPRLAVLTAASALAAAVIERWLLFAQAEHASGLFYGAESV